MVHVWHHDIVDLGKGHEPKTAAAADGYECRCLGGNEGAEDLSNQLKLPKGQRALLVVRPDGYVAVSHRGVDKWDAEAVAQGMADCGLMAPNKEHRQKRQNMSKHGDFS